MSAAIFPIAMADGCGFLLTTEISAILPVADKRRKGWSFLLADCLPEGIEIKGTPEELKKEWELRLLALEMGEDDWHDLAIDQEGEGDECTTPG